MDGAGRGTLFVLSAPSGTGKSSLCRRLLEEVPGLSFSISHTTRPRRAGEENGRQYWFVDEERFTGMAEAGDFLEWADVFGQRYGTARAAVERELSAGRDLLLDIDVQGARQVRGSGLDSVSIFILPPDFPTLESRLRARRSDDEVQVRRRLSLARGETEDFGAYDYLVVNDELERAVSDLTAIVTAERLRTPRSARTARRILETFPAPHAGA